MGTFQKIIRTIAPTLMIVAGVIALSHCSQKASESKELESKFKNVTQDQVKKTHVELAYAMYTDSLNAAKTLQKSIDTFLANPSEKTLLAAKSAYKAARAPYQESEIMRFDGDITAGKNLEIGSVDDWEGQVNAWPLDEGLIDYVATGTGGEGAENFISSKQKITKDALISLNGAKDNEANVATGVHAIEFLLWGQDLNGTKAGAGARAFTDYMSEATGKCTNKNCDRRREYLKVVTQLLVDDLTQMQAQWAPEAYEKQGTLANNVLNSDIAIDYILGSIRSMATAELASARMAAAFEANDTEEEHDCFSDLSHVAIYHNFQGVKNAFYGKYNGKSEMEGPSLADLIKQADANEYKQFDTSLKKIEAKMRAVYEAGENGTTYDQLVGLTSEQSPARKAADEAIIALLTLDFNLNTVRQLLSLKEFSEISGDGD